MNIKTIIFGCVAVGIATGGALLNKTQTTEQATYNPRLAEKELHKGSADYVDYLHSLRANQITGEIDIAEYNRVKQEVLAISRRNNKAALNLNWANQGPDNVGGRTRAILVDNSNPNIVYAGSVAGGLYVSTDGAGSWTPVGEMADNLAISCITQTASGRIFFGTGSTFDGAGGQIGFTPGFVGNGVYEYVPSTGQILPVLVNSGTVPNNSTNQTLSYVNAIASRGERLYVGHRQGLRLADPDGNGLYPTDVNLWTNPIHVIQGNPLLEASRVFDIDVASNGSMVVCFNNKVYHSFSDADDSFTRSSITGSRISAAIAPSDPNYIYVVATNGSLSGLYLSNTFDANNKPEFAVIVPGGVPAADPFLQNDGTGPQGSWDQCIAVDPSDPGRCLVGGIQLFEYNAVTTTPGPGDWVKTTHLSAPVGAPYYIHADKHTFAWVGNTVYVGSDGGVAKSTDGGLTWSTKNLGFNTATFFTVSTNALGWMFGGAQDNGCQLVTYGAFNNGSPLSAVQLLGGDGFDTELSNLGDGLAFSTVQSGGLTRTGPTGGGGSFLAGDLINGANIFHTSISYWESTYDNLSTDSIKIVFDTSGTFISPGNKIYAGDTIFAGDTIIYSSLTNALDLMYIAPSNIITTYPIDSIYLVDYIQNKMSYAFPDASAIYMTKDAARLNAANIGWYRIAGPTSTPSAFSGVAYAMEFTPDGNTLFAGSSNGRLYRIDNLSTGNDSLSIDIRSAASLITCTQIGNFPGRNILGIAIDPNDANNVIVTLGNYGNTNYIYRSTDALTSTVLTGFTSIQGPASPGTGYLPRMPIYDAEIDFTNNNTVVIGTEWGVWGSDNAFTGAAAAVQWTEENTGIGHVPVFQVRQQTLRNLPTSGMMYLGSHGKGFWSSTDLITGIDDLGAGFNDKEDGFVSNLTIFPNPLNTVGTITFNLKSNAKTVAKIYNLSGSLVKTLDLGMLNKGEHNERFDATNLSIGSYIVAIESGNERTVAKFIVTR